ncbi:DinB family protein, partial [Rhizobium ruizarguesonis]
MPTYDTVRPFSKLAYNNALANRRLLQACAALKHGEFEAQRTSFFPSIKENLNHIITVDW